MPSLTIPLDDALSNRLREEAFRQRRHKTEIVRELIEQWLERTATKSDPKKQRLTISPPVDQLP